MAEAQPGLSDLLNLLGSANPLGPLTKNLETLKRGIEGLVTAVGTFTRTMETLEEATKRVTALLDDVEQPVRSVIEQLASLPADSLPRTIENLNTLSTTLSQLAAPLSGVAGLAGSLLGGLRTSSSSASPSSSEPAASTASAPTNESERPSAATPKRRAAPRRSTK
jgi:ABC-type transporter Mla subunit MlaD